jgi:hypothetical protein
LDPDPDLDHIPHPNFLESQRNSLYNANMYVALTH